MCIRIFSLLTRDLLLAGAAGHGDAPAGTTGTHPFVSSDNKNAQPENATDTATVYVYNIVT